MKHKKSKSKDLKHLKHLKHLKQKINVINDTNNHTNETINFIQYIDTTHMEYFIFLNQIYPIYSSKDCMDWFEQFYNHLEPYFSTSYSSIVKLSTTEKYTYLFIYKIYLSICIYIRSKTHEYKLFKESKLFSSSIQTSEDDWSITYLYKQTCLALLKNVNIKQLEIETLSKDYLGKNNNIKWNKCYFNLYEICLSILNGEDTNIYNWSTYIECIDDELKMVEQRKE